MPTDGSEQAQPLRSAGTVRFLHRRAHETTKTLVSNSPFPGFRLFETKSEHTEFETKPRAWCSLRGEPCLCAQSYSSHISCLSHARTCLAPSVIRVLLPRRSPRLNDNDLYLIERRCQAGIGKKGTQAPIFFGTHLLRRPPWCVP